jgi:hypothetical protein
MNYYYICSLNRYNDKCNIIVSQLMYAYIDAGCFAIFGRIWCPRCVCARSKRRYNVGRLPLDLSRCTAARQLKGRWLDLWRAPPHGHSSPRQGPWLPAKNRCALSHKLGTPHRLVLPLC